MHGIVINMIDGIIDRVLHDNLQLLKVSNNNTRIKLQIKSWLEEYRLDLKVEIEKHKYPITFEQDVFAVALIDLLGDNE